jgi:hypothetical protein
MGECENVRVGMNVTVILIEKQGCIHTFSEQQNCLSCIGVWVGLEQSATVPLLYIVHCPRTTEVAAGHAKIPHQLNELGVPSDMPFTLCTTQHSSMRVHIYHLGAYSSSSTVSTRHPVAHDLEGIYSVV